MAILLNLVKFPSFFFILILPDNILFIIIIIVPFFLFFSYTSCTLFRTNKPPHPHFRRIILEYEGVMYIVEVEVECSGCVNPIFSRPHPVAVEECNWMQLISQTS